MNAEAPVVELKQITKRFPGIVANDSISLTLKKGKFTRFSARMVRANRR